MRDPAGRVTIADDSVSRVPYPAGLPAVEFLNTSIARELVSRGLVVPFTIESDNTIRSERYRFVTYPHEWADAQLLSAANLTLDISQSICKSRHELKDASAWNVIFEGCHPRFCDHFSFQPIDGKYWWAFGQFARHFLLPLAISKQRGIRAHQMLGLHRDGVPQEFARSLLGVGRFLTRYWPLLLRQGGQLGSADSHRTSRTVHHSLYEYCRYLLGGVQSTSGRTNYWLRYQTDRSHYDAESIEAKRQRVGNWIQAIRPQVVFDLGSNVGEFTSLALGEGATVIALDSDHDCVDKLFRQNSSSSRLYPIVADLSDLHGGRGWMASEYLGLIERFEGASDLVLMLALIHHLAIAEGLSFEQIALLASRFTRKYVIVELLSSLDPMTIRMAHQRRRNPIEFDQQRQLTAFEKYFTISETIDVPGTHRALALLVKKH